MEQVMLMPAPASCGTATAQNDFILITQSGDAQLLLIYWEFPENTK